ncbi:MAG: beta-glucuronidase [Ruminococcus sp.]|nr:beta-glucuronidase [Ruminococcus sp.]
MIRSVDISGEWQLYMDKTGKSREYSYNDTIILPSTTSYSKKGEENTARETGHLTDTYKFEGAAWFRRKIKIDSAEGERAELFLERTRLSALFIDGCFCGRCDSLNTPHTYDITPFADGGEHDVQICVKNIGYPTGGGHLTSPDTQTNWNGITGRMEIRFYSRERLSEIRIFPNIATGKVTVKGCISYALDVRVSVKSFNSKKTHTPPTQSFKLKPGRLLEFTFKYDMGKDLLLWSEHEPALYKMTIEAGEDKYEYIFGMRKFSHNGEKFLINGKPTFLRGKHDGLIFPKTGFAPTDVDEWLRVLGIAKSYGINHYRFHTCCPPEACFEAADRLGIYLEPQLPFWGTIHEPGEEGYNKEEQEYLVKEGFRILEAYGSHPSFCMFSLGNELWGSGRILNEILREYKEYDDRHLYTQGSNNFQWFPSQLENDDFFVGVRLAGDRLIRGSYAMCDAPQGHIQTAAPSTVTDYDSAIHPKRAAHSSEVSEDGTVQIQYGTTMKTVKASEADADFVPTVPIVTHEIGQYETFPDFDEINKYTGSVKARNFEVFRERLEGAGLLPLAKGFFECSGRLAAACYKEELEAVFRSRLLAGCQILDLQDFSGQGTALVGMLDAFMDSKGILTPEEYRQFCSDAVLLARFSSYVCRAGESFKAHIELAYFRPERLSGKRCEVELKSENGTKIFSKAYKVSTKMGSYIDIADISTRLPISDKPERYTLKMRITDTDIQNSYTITAYPETGLDEGCIFTRLTKKADRLLDEGKTVLLVSLPAKSRSIEGTYCTDFWCYPMFKKISDMMKKPRPIGTMGLMIDSGHEALGDFPSERWSTPDWYDIVSASRSEIIDSSDKTVIVRTIDNFERNADLALLYEYKKSNGKVVRLCADLERLKGSLSGRRLLSQLIKYTQNENGGGKA